MTSLVYHSYTNSIYNQNVAFMMVMKHEQKLHGLKLCIDLVVAFRLGIQVLYHMKEIKPFEIDGFALCLFKNKFFDTTILNRHLNDNTINYNGILWNLKKKVSTFFKHKFVVFDFKSMFLENMKSSL
jgi:hypothetical protein